MASQAQLQSLVQPVVESMDCELWGLELLQQGRHSLMRIFIDKPGGVTLDDCEQVSRQVSAVLDVEDPITGAYTLEVSSPGLDRPLFTAEQFARYVGEVVAVRLRTPFEGRRKFTGQLRGLEADDVVLVVDDHEYLLPLEQIDKANLVPRF